MRKKGQYITGAFVALALIVPMLAHADTAGIPEHGRSNLYSQLLGTCADERAAATARATGWYLAAPTETGVNGQVLGTPEVVRSFLAFDTSGFEPGTVITSATLNVAQSSDTDDAYAIALPSITLPSLQGDPVPVSIWGSFDMANVLGLLHYGQGTSKDYELDAGVLNGFFNPDGMTMIGFVFSSDYDGTCIPTGSAQVYSVQSTLTVEYTVQEPATVSFESLSGSTLVSGVPYPFRVAWQGLSFRPRYGQVNMNGMWFNAWTPFVGYGDGQNLTESGSKVINYTYWSNGLYSPVGWLSEYSQYPGQSGTGSLEALNLSGSTVRVVSPSSPDGLDVQYISHFDPVLPGAPVVIGEPACFTWAINPGVCGGTGSVSSVKFFHGYPPGTPVIDTGSGVALTGSGCFTYTEELPTPQDLFFPTIEERCADGTAHVVHLGGSYSASKAGSLTTAAWNPFTVHWVDLGTQPATGHLFRNSTGATIAATGGLLRFDTDGSLYSRLAPVSVRYNADIPFAVTSVRLLADALGSADSVDITPDGGFKNRTLFYHQFSYATPGTYQPAIEFLGAGQSAFLMYRGGLESPDAFYALTVTADTYQPPGGTVAPLSGTSATLPNILGLNPGQAFIPIPADASPVIKIAAAATNEVISVMLKIAGYEYSAISTLPFVRYLQNFMAPAPGIVHNVPASLTILGRTVALPEFVANKQFTISYGCTTISGRNCETENNVLIPMFQLAVIFGLGTIAFRMIF